MLFYQVDIHRQHKSTAPFERNPWNGRDANTGGRYEGCDLYSAYEGCN